MEYYLHIKPTFNCLFKSGNYSKTLRENRIFSFLVNTDEEVFDFSFYPMNDEISTSLPFSSAFIYSQKKLCTKSNNIDLIVYPNDNLLLIVRPFFIGYPKPFNIQSKQISFANKTHTIYWNKNDIFTFRIENENFVFLDIDNPLRIIDLNIKTSDNLCLFYARTTKNTYLVGCISYKNNQYKLEFQEEVNLLERKQDKILTYKNLCDIAHHGQTKEYTFSPHFQVKSNLVITADSPFTVKQKELIVFAFFEALQVTNFNLARSYLSPTLSKRLSDKQLVKFFGNYLFPCEALSNSKNFNEIALIYQENGIKIAKIFLIQLNKDNKIENIVEQN